MSTPLYNSRIIDTYLKLLQAQYEHVQISEILSYAGIKAYEVADQGHWFTQEQIDRFHEKTVQLTGNDLIAREAGRFAAKPGTLGAMRQYGLSLAGPLKAFSIIGSSTKKFVRSSEYTSQILSKTKVEVCVTPKPGVEEKAFQCDNRIGFFEAIINGFNIAMPKIEHPECLFRGGQQCRYIISWPHNKATYVKRFRDIFLAGGLVTILCTLPFSTTIATHVVTPIVGFAAIFAAWLAEVFRASELEKGMNHLWGASDQLAEQIDLNYRNAELAANVGDVIASRTNIDEVINAVVQVLQKTLDYDRGLVLLADKSNSRLEIRGAYGYIDQHLDLLNNISFRLDNPQSKGVFVLSFRERKPFLVNNAKDIEKTLSPKSQQFLQALETHAFICVPIVLEGHSIGVLAVDNLATNRPFVMSDVNLLMGITPAIALSIQNANHLEARAAQFDSILQVLADSIDARDFLTAGHSEKVAEYSVGIAEGLGLSKEVCHVIRMAALLHDYGKIGIPDSILKKSGPLTDEERAVIYTHPTKTKQILEKVAFEGAFKEIPAICYAHHERWDGKGYPNALRGEEIPLGARIIAAADFYEAITAERHYRQPMPADEALKTFLAESGKYFQPEIADALVAYLAEHSVCLLHQDPGPDQAKDRAGGSEKTRQLRVPYRAGVSAQAAQKVITGTSVNISRGGLFVQSPETEGLVPAAEIQVTFSLPPGDHLARVRGKVAWVNTDTHPSLTLPNGFGIKFEQIDQEVQETIDVFVNTCLQPYRQTML